MRETPPEWERGRGEGRLSARKAPGAAPPQTAHPLIRSAPRTRPLPPGEVAPLAPAAGDALDLGADQALDDRRQVVVEPVLEQRPQHLAHEVLERAGVRSQEG